MQNLLPPAAYWVHDLDPVILPITQTLAVRWYGLAYVMGFFAAWALLKLYHGRGRSPYGAEARADLLTAIIVGIIVGGRLGHILLYDIAPFLENPLYFFMVWKGGMASHGGMAGVAVALYWFARKTGTSFTRLGDIAVTLAPPGILLGRIANFVNGELWGRVSSVKWAVIFPEAQYPEYFEPDGFTVFSEKLGIIANPRHPSQLYEAALEGLILGIYIQLRFWLTDRSKCKPGSLAGEFFVVYALLRIVGEQFRQPDHGVSLILGLPRGVFYSILLAGIGLWLIFRPVRKSS